jgi:hypothetical protein
LDRLAPNGQVPANVRIDDGVPDYSGVGGICSIDSGLWLIIAFHAFTSARRGTSNCWREYHDPICCG